MIQKIQMLGWEWDSCVSGEDDGGCDEVEDESFYAGSDFGDPVRASNRNPSEMQAESKIVEEKLAASLGELDFDANSNFVIKLLVTQYRVQH